MSRFEEITVPMYDGDGETYVGRFEGTWLNDPELESDKDYTGTRRHGHDGAPHEWIVGVAETPRGVAVYIHHWNYDYDKPPELHGFNSIANATGALAGDARVPSYLFESLPRVVDFDV